MNRKLNEPLEAEHYTIGTEGAENSHQHLCVIFDDLEGTYLSIFQVFHTESKKKKMYLSGTPHPCAAVLPQQLSLCHSSLPAALQQSAEPREQWGKYAPGCVHLLTRCP